MKFFMHDGYRFADIGRDHPFVHLTTPEVYRVGESWCVRSRDFYGCKSSEFYETEAEARDALAAEMAQRHIVCVNCCNTDAEFRRVEREWRSLYAERLAQAVAERPAAQVH